MGKVIPYLSVKNAKNALEMYKSIFDITDVQRSPVTEEQRSMFSIPEDTDLATTTIHGEFKIDGQPIYISDNFSGKVLDEQNVSILIHPDSLKRAQDIFNNATSNDCDIKMEFKQQFWGDYFGSFVDPFGISWQVNFTPN